MEAQKEYNQTIREATREVYDRIQNRQSSLREAIREELEQDPPSDKETAEERLQRLQTRLTEEASRQKQQAQEDVFGAHEAAILGAVALIASIGEDDAPTPESYAPDIGFSITINARRPVSESTSSMISSALQKAGTEISEAIEDEGDIGPIASRLFSRIKRIVSHEAATVADETNKLLAAKNPAVDLVKWELSVAPHPRG